MADNGLITRAATCHMPTTKHNLCLTAENVCALQRHTPALHMRLTAASASLLPISFAVFNLNFCLANQCVSIWCSAPYFVLLFLLPLLSAAFLGKVQFNLHCIAAACSQCKCALVSFVSLLLSNGLRWLLPLSLLLLLLVVLLFLCSLSVYIHLICVWMPA